MSITEVAYGFTFNIGNYQSERIDCKIAVEPGETPEQAMDRARLFVEQQRQRRQEVLSLNEHIKRLRGQEDNLQSKIKQVKVNHRQAVERFNELRALLALHGVQIEELSRYYLPDEEQEPAAELDESADEDEDDDDDREDYDDDRESSF